MKEKALRNTQIRSMHEMGEMKRAQEQRVDELYVQKLRERPEKIQRLTAEPRQTLATSYMEYVWITGKRFW